MNPSFHISVPRTPQEREAMMKANTTAVQLKDEAMMRGNRGDCRGAIEQHKKALHLKINAYGEQSMQQRYPIMPSARTTSFSKCGRKPKRISRKP